MRVGDNVRIVRGYNIGQVAVVTAISREPDGRTLLTLGWPGLRPAHKCSGPGCADARDVRLWDEAAKRNFMDDQL